MKMIEEKDFLQSHPVKNPVFFIIVIPLGGIKCPKKNTQCDFLFLFTNSIAKATHV